jgi:hypothetical protein
MLFDEKVFFQIKMGVLIKIHDSMLLDFLNEKLKNRYK